MIKTFKRKASSGADKAIGELGNSGRYVEMMGEGGKTVVAVSVVEAKSIYAARKSYKCHEHRKMFVFIYFNLFLSLLR